MNPSLPWIVATISVLALIGMATWWWMRERLAANRPLPSHWALSPRPVFSHPERRMYKQLQEALPHQVILAKLPLLRICQPNDPGQVGYWYSLLGSAHVGFLVCSPAGRALLAIDLEDGRPPARRTQQIKQQVLHACGIRLVRFHPDHLPSLAEVRMLIPGPSADRRPAALPGHEARMLGGRSSATADAAVPRRSRWKHSNFSADTLFGPEGAPDGFSDTRAEPRLGSDAAAALARQGPGTVADIRPISPQEFSRVFLDTPPQRH